MADQNRVQVADWLADDYAELQTDPDYVAQGILIDIAVQLGEIMEAEGIDSQKELADRLDMTPSAVSQIMSGEQNMSIERLVKIALSLGLTLEAPKFVQKEKTNIEAVPTPPKRVAVHNDTTFRQGKLTHKSGYGWTGARTGNEEHVSVQGEAVPAGAGSDEDALA